MITRVDHIDLKVPDISATVAFLRQLGLTTVRDDGDSVEVTLPGPNQVRFEVREDRTLDAIRVDHVAFTVEDAATTLTELKNKGIEFDRERITIGRTGRTVSNITGPHGFKWQLAELPQEEPERRLASGVRSSGAGSPDPARPRSEQH